MLRSVIALIAGFALATFTVLTATIAAALAMDVSPGQPTTEYLAVNLAYSTGAAIFGGYATAALAPERPSAHVLILALMMLIVAVSGFINPQPGQERWYLAALIVLSPAGAYVGGLLRAARNRRRAATTP